MYYRQKGNLLYCTCKQVRVSYAQLIYSVYRNQPLMKTTRNCLLMTKQLDLLKCHSENPNMNFHRLVILKVNENLNS